MYSVDIDAEVSEQVEALPPTALLAFAELMVVREPAPCSGDPFNRKHPERNMRTMTFGDDGAGLVVYLVIEDQQRVSLLRVIWAF